MERITVWLEYIDNSGWHKWKSISIQGERQIIYGIGPMLFEKLCWAFIFEGKFIPHDAVKQSIIYEKIDP